MGNKEKLAVLLLEGGEEYVSGSVIADMLGVSRAAVWKNIRLLENDGYKIEAVNNKGYRLSPDNDVITKEAFEYFLHDEQGRFTAEVYETIDSTNTFLKSKADQMPDRTVVIAGYQTKGRGRIGRNFYSPAGTGLYLSVLLKENIRFADAGRLTTAAAVAACRAIENCTDVKPLIKWVNDVFVNDRKVCGILTEASVNYETGIPDWLVTGIGFNVYEPEGGFPEEIAGIAGAVCKEKKKNLRAALAAEFVRCFYDSCGDLQNEKLHREYKDRCFILGQPIYVIKGETRVPAQAVDIDNEFALRVRYENGEEELLNAGEVSVRPSVNL